jgi:CubicO group peptidase (beta-lactamase class C family)
MTRSIGALILVAGAAACTGGSPMGDDVGGDDIGGDDAPAACGEDAAAKFDEVFATFAGAVDDIGLPGGAIAVVCGGETIFARGHGETRRTGGSPITEHTRFQLASNTKMLTAITAVKLAQDGAVELDAPVSSIVSYVNDRDPFATPFTLSHLLAHTAGMPGPPDDALELDSEAYFRAHGDLALWNPPDALWQYSNLGFALAGHALEVATGQSFAELVDDQVFAPLGLADSSMRPLADPARSAYGHTTWFGPGEEVVPPDDEFIASSIYGPMGGGWSSAADVAALARELINGGGAVLDASGLAELTATRSPTDITGLDYGYGLMTTPDGIWTHSGLTSGWSSDLTMIPADGFAVVTLVNGDLDFPFEAIDAAIAAFSTWTPVGDAPPPQPPASALAGTYQSADLGTLVIASGTGSSLTITVGGDTVPLRWSYERTFRFAYAPWQAEIDATFWADDTGRFSYLATPAGVGIR